MIARDCDGNAAIVEHMRTGLLYHTAEEFLLMAGTLTAEQSELRQRLIEAGRAYVDLHFSFDNECRQYGQMFAEVERRLQDRASTIFVDQANVFTV